MGASCAALPPFNPLSMPAGHSSIGESFILGKGPPCGNGEWAAICALMAAPLPPLRSSLMEHAITGGAAAASKQQQGTKQGQERVKQLQKLQPGDKTGRQGKKPEPCAGEGKRVALALDVSAPGALAAVDAATCGAADDGDRAADGKRDASGAGASSSVASGRGSTAGPDAACAAGSAMQSQGARPTIGSVPGMSFKIVRGQAASHGEATSGACSVACSAAAQQAPVQAQQGKEEQEVQKGKVAAERQSGSAVPGPAPVKGQTAEAGLTDAKSGAGAKPPSGRGKGSGQSQGQAAGAPGGMEAAAPRAHCAFQQMMLEGIANGSATTDDAIRTLIT